MTYLLDTNMAIYLAMQDFSRFSTTQKTVVSNINNSMVLPAMSLLEIEYLYEIGRISISADVIVNHLVHFLQIVESIALFSDVARIAQKIKFTRDPFDRLIVAESMHSGSALITTDRKIISNYSNTVA